MTARYDRIGTGYAGTRREDPDLRRRIQAAPAASPRPTAIATTEDGRSLADEGPRLLVPSSDRGGRHVFGVARIRLDRGR